MQETLPDPAESEPTLVRVGTRFAPIPEPLLMDASISAGAVRLWGVLDRIAARDRIWPGREYLAGRLDLSVATVDRYVKELRDSGWLQVRRRGLGLTNLYRLFDQPQPCGPGVRTGEDPDLPPVLATDLPPTRNYREEAEREEEKRERDTPAQPALVSVPNSLLVGFDAFWSSYPRKTAKDPARKAWTKATKRTPPADILIGLERHLPDLRARESKFVPHAATWLNDRRWEDEPEPPSAKQRSPAARREEHHITDRDPSLTGRIYL